MVVTFAYYVKFANSDNCTNLLTVSLQYSESKFNEKEEEGEENNTTPKHLYVCGLTLARCLRFRISMAYAPQRSKGAC